MVVVDVLSSSLSAVVLVSEMHKRSDVYLFV